MPFRTMCVACLLTLVAATSLRAQGAEAIAGTPFGVGRVTVNLQPEAAARALADNSIVIQERDGRVHYPAITEGRVRRVLNNLLGTDGSGAVTIYFLFTGDEPLELTVLAPQPHPIEVAPRRDNERQRQRLMTQWWRSFHSLARANRDQADYPPIVETYLTSMLSRRLQLAPPLLERLDREPNVSETQETVEQLFAVEKLRHRMLRETNERQRVNGQVANRPLPDGPQWLPLSVEYANDVRVEPIARQVPPECFYIRFGSYANYLWIEQLLEDYGGELGSMISLRGHDAKLSKRVQRQLALQQTELSKLLGGTVISDVALIGRDLYMREGAAIGMLFQARESRILKADLLGQHKEGLAREKANGAVLETIQIAGRDVSKLSTPDNRVRSFYVDVGDYHLVTTSRALLERFIEIGGKPEASLGDSAEFRHARTMLPLDRDDTVYLYFSSQFLQSLLSPQYQIELRRRLQAVVDLELVQLARLAAKAEAKPADNVEQLINGGFLPAGFGARADGSEPLIVEGQPRDSIRGGRGSFLPIPDVPIAQVTEDEEASYRALAASSTADLRQMDPILIGVKRYALNRKGLERVTLDAYVAPVNEHKYEWLISMLGPPTRQVIESPPGSVVSAQAAIRGGLISPQVPQHLLYLGIQDNFPAGELEFGSFLETLQTIRSVPGYLGAWPKPGFLDMLPWGLGGQPDVAGYSQLPLGLWRRQGGDFSTLSFQRGVLEFVTPHLKVAEASEPAHLRLNIGDLSQAAFGSWINSMHYSRARQTSLGNVRFLHLLSQQLGVPREEARTVAESLLDTQLVCTLGGKYVLLEELGNLPSWTSTALTVESAVRTPDKYQSPALEWFRGLEGDATRLDDRFAFHVQLDMQRKRNEIKLDLPLFQFFNGKKKDEKKKDKAEELPALPAPKKGREFE